MPKVILNNSRHRIEARTHYTNKNLMVNIMRNIIVSFIALVFLTFPLSVMAQINAKGIPQFLPTTGWTVKPAVTGDLRQLNNIKLPCMMMVEYDNGYIVRLSGGDYNLMAMAIDFRQEAFVQGRKYQASIMVDGKNTGKVEATAFSNNALIINTRQVENLYQTLQSGKSMSMNIEGNKFQFTLGDVSQALTRMEACYSGKQVEMSTASLSSPMGAGAGAPQSIVSGTPEAASWGAPMAGIVEMPKNQPRRTKPNQIWRANQGDSLKATLTRWADEAGVKIDWQADDMQGDLMLDYALATSFEEAVQTVIAQNAAATGIQANLIGGSNNMIEDAYKAGPPTPLMVSSPASTPSMVRNSSPQPAPSYTSNRSANWSANQGTNLRVALEQWSQKAGVEFYWQANQSYAVRSNIASNGSYEDALRQILSQYTSDSVRPLAQLNNDPATGRRILIIQSSNVL